MSAAALLPLAARAGLAANQTTPQSSGIELLSGLTMRSFAANLNDTFDIHVSALHSQKMELTEVTKNKKSGNFESFKITFDGTGEAFPQGTYQLVHNKMGSFPLFLVPLRTEKANKLRYEAVFGRVR